MTEAVPYKIIALFGKSGSGKDTIRNWMVSLPNTNKIINTTTRPKRDYEKDDKDYHFISHLDFLKKVEEEEFIEYKIFNKWFYGTQISSLKKDKINIGAFNIGAITLMLKNPKLEILPIQICSSDKVRLQRNLKREQNPDCREICRRFLRDEEDFKKIKFDYEIFLNNSDNRDFFNIQNLPKIKNFLNK